MMETLAQYVYFMPLLLGAIFLLLTFILYKFPPKKINALYGYRTPSSMMNQQRWDFAQMYSTRRMFEAGVFMALVSLLKSVIGDAEMAEIIVGFGALFLSAAYMIISTELALKKNFPKNVA